MLKYKEPCFYCQRDMRIVGKTNDHVIPISKGGTNRGNIVRCCWDCNQFKSNKDLDDWLNELRTIIRSSLKHDVYTNGELGNIVSGIKKLLRPKVKSRKSRVKQILFQQLKRLSDND